jgi:hypothetical protein
VIIVGDFNEQLSDDPNLIASTCAQFNLCEALEYHHGDGAMVPTYICGSKRLDYVFVQQELQPFLLASGLNLFNECVYSDHRATFLDINLRAFLGDCVPKLAQLQHHSVTSKSQFVDKFVSKVHLHLVENKVFHQYQEFLLDIDGMAKPWVPANTLDDMPGHAFDTAEKNCAVRPSEPWSSKLHIASRKVRYWKMMLTQRFTGTTQDRVLAELAKEVWPGETPPPAPSNNYVIRKVSRAAEKSLTRVRRDSKQERETFLQELREKLAMRVAPTGTNTAVAVNSIDRQLNDTKIFSRIAKAIKPTGSPALTKVEITTTREYLHPHTSRRTFMNKATTIDVRAKLEAVIVQRNRRHFAQAQGTPFTEFPLNLIRSDNDFNTYQDSAGNNISLPNDAFIETHTIIDILRQRAQLPVTRWSPELDFEDFLAALLHWRESTSTSPSGRHLGLYKVLATAHCNSSGEFSASTDPEDPEDPTTQEKATQILHLIHGLATQAALNGFYLRRWTQVVNVMIYKNPGYIELDRLWVIHLFEADFNLLVGVYFGRRAMYHQVDGNLLHEGQFGKPGGECQDAAISKVLHNMISIFTKTPMGKFESDATACFDREVMNFVFACYRSHGAPMGPLQIWEQVLLNVVHRVKTAYGTSIAGFLHLWRQLPHPWTRTRISRRTQFMLNHDCPPY